MKRLAAAVTAGALLATAPAALAHTEVVAQTPKSGAYAKRTTKSVSARFSQTIRSGQLRVFRGSTKVSSGAGRRSSRNAATVTASIAKRLRPGRYTVRWTAKAADGHTLRGSWSFKVR